MGYLDCELDMMYEDKYCIEEDFGDDFEPAEICGACGFVYRVTSICADCCACCDCGRQDEEE